MNVNPIIIGALCSLKMPVVPNNYEGDADEYIAFNYADERPIISGNDTDLIDRTIVHVHYFTKSNPQQNKKAIRRLLRAAGFTIISTAEFYEDDTRYTHVVVEAEIDGQIDD